jgi:hypothetical protein
MEMGGRIGTSNAMTGDQFNVIPAARYANTPYLLTFPLHRLDDLIVHLSG